MVEVCRSGGQSLPAMFHLNPCAGELIRAKQIAHDSHSAEIQSILGEAAAIDAGTGERKKHKALLDAARIVIEPRHFQIGESRSERLAERYPRQQLAESHRPN